jgi:flavin reductase (DIM6/NTAB) family NADH-FMN oxidoreductase RutF
MIMHKEIDYQEYASEVITQLSQSGVFLTVKNGAGANIMTIGWGTIGTMWGKPILMVMVRYCRHTYGLLEKAGEFTVSVPRNRDLSKELLICGRESGREIDKFKACGFTPLKSQVVDTPVIKECPLHFECRVVYQQAMEPGQLTPALRDKWYGNHDYHVLYFGEIVARYLTE